MVQLMEPALRPLHDDFIMRYRRTKEARVIDQRERRVYGVNKLGKKLPLLLSLTSIRSGENLTFVGVFQKVRTSICDAWHNALTCVCDSLMIAVSKCKQTLRERLLRSARAAVQFLDMPLVS